MLTIDPKNISTAELQGYLQGAVAPRPIAFASTIDADGNPNLSPFSFFNVFSANPPILVFSPSRRVRDNTSKHTLQNVEKVKEVVINIVNFDMVQQMSLSSCEYPQGVSEFVKAGFTPIPSHSIKPFRVAEAPVQFECKVNQIISLGNDGGAGNFVICEVLKIHINENVLDKNGTIDQNKIDLVSRMGGNWYSRAKEGLFEIPKPVSELGIGVDAIPKFIKKSKIFSGNDLGALANVSILPNSEEITTFVNNNIDVKTVLSTDDEMQIQQKAKDYLNKNMISEAWKTLLAERIK